MSIYTLRAAYDKGVNAAYSLIITRRTKPEEPEPSNPFLGDSEEREQWFEGFGWAMARHGGDQ